MAKLLKWNMMSNLEKARMIDDFWRDYFRKYPKMGAMDEVNILRTQYAPRKRTHHETKTQTDL